MKKEKLLELALRSLLLLIRLGCDAVLLAGLFVFVYGLSLAWRPLGFIAGGLLASAVAFFFGYSQTHSQTRKSS